MRMRVLAASLAVAVLGLGFWSAGAIFAEPAARRTVLLRDTPHIAQRPDFCGEACVAMALQRLKADVDQDAVFDASGLDPLLGRGCYTAELAKAARKLGFDVGDVWRRIDAKQPTKGMDEEFAAVYRDLHDGVPSILCMHYDERAGSSEHFRLVVGYDAATDELVYHEPAVRGASFQRMKRATLYKLWPLKYDAAQWTLIRLPLRAKQIAAPQPAASFTDADYAQHIRKLRGKLPSDDFHIVIEKPFVVVGDEDAATVKRRATGTVRWAVERLKRQYFQKDPDDILTIWLFKDKASYDKHAEQLFGQRPHTPYGYFSPAHGALVMNISTGGGTLVHEIVHPFIASNFPDCPSWFNEGLASLYEQSQNRDGRIWGATNWRLSGLQRAIAAKAVPSFSKLCSTTTRQFYDDDAGTNYAQARYLCYYLQERGLLQKYYNEFRKNAKGDPTGYATLQQVLGEDDMADFQQRWEQYVSKLRY